jgi:hypothetical protein
MKCIDCQLRDEYRYCQVVDHQTQDNNECEATDDQLNSFVEDCNLVMLSYSECIDAVYQIQIQRYKK